MMYAHDVLVLCPSIAHMLMHSAWCCQERNAR